MIPAILPTYARAPLSFVKGEGSWVIEADGRRFLDFGAGIAVNALGHAHPELVEALCNQARNLWHTSNLYEIPVQRELAEKLVDLTFADTVFFCNSGTEAAELAIKMVRKKNAATKRHKIITFEGAFHGRSIGAISAAGSKKLTEGFAPLLPGFIHLPWTSLTDPGALEAAASDPEAAAIMVEPIQGEGGIRALEPEVLRQLREVADAHGLLLVFDEVQCGTGRTGRLFAHEQAGITPDIMMIAKGIGGGFPLGAILATEDAAAQMGTGSHGTTYGGNPLACSIGKKILEIIAAPAFLENVTRKSDKLRAGLLKVIDAHPGIFTELRGRGLMLGLACGVPNGDVIKAAYKQQLLIVPAADNVVRLLPPLNISSDEIDEALSRLSRVAGELTKQKDYAHA